MCGNRNDDLLLKHRSTGWWMTHHHVPLVIGQLNVDRDLLLVYGTPFVFVFSKSDRNFAMIHDEFMWQNDETTKMSTIRDYFCLWRDLGTLTVVPRGLTSTVPFGWPPLLCCSWPPGSPEMFRSWTLSAFQNRTGFPNLRSWAISHRSSYIHTMFRNNLITFHGWLVCNLLQLPFWTLVILHHDPHMALWLLINLHPHPSGQGNWQLCTAPGNGGLEKKLFTKLGTDGISESGCFVGIS